MRAQEQEAAAKKAQVEQEANEEAMREAEAKEEEMVKEQDQDSSTKQLRVEQEAKWREQLQTVTSQTLLGQHLHSKLGSEVEEVRAKLQQGQVAAEAITNEIEETETAARTTHEMHIADCTRHTQRRARPVCAPLHVPIATHSHAVRWAA